VVQHRVAFLTGIDDDRIGRGGRVDNARSLGFIQARVGGRSLWLHYDGPNRLVHGCWCCLTSWRVARVSPSRRSRWPYAGNEKSLALLQRCMLHRLLPKTLVTPRYFKTMSEAAAQNLQPDPQTGEMISKRFDFRCQQECGSSKDTSELKPRRRNSPPV
jgi:hypothetical protein